MSKEASYFYDFWQQQHTPLHFHNAEEWYQKYADEIYFYLQGKKKIIDAGCGSGDIIKPLSTKFDYILGVDFSASMIDTAKINLKVLPEEKYSLHVGNIVNLKDFATSKFDGLYANQAIQYLNSEEIGVLLRSLDDIMTPDATILFLNIPNRNLKFLFKNRVFHHQHEQEYSTGDYMGFFMKEFFRNAGHSVKSLIRRMVRGKGLLKVDASGFWQTPKYYIDLCSKHGYEAEILNSIYPPYGYRFHVLLKKKK